MLNLLPESKKELLRTDYQFKTILKYCMLLTGLCVIFSLLMVGNYYLLKQTLNKTQASILLSTINISGVDNLKSDILSFNERLAVVQNIQAEHINPLFYYDQLASLIPENVTIHNIKLDFTNSVIELSGTAKTRENLLEVQNQLNNNDYFFNFDYPISNLNEKEDVAFTFQGQINLANHVQK